MGETLALRDSPPLPMRPDGPLGRPFAWLMEAMNGGDYRRTLKALSPAPGNALLELGFGTGAFLEMVARQMNSGLFVGVDPSPLMVKMAMKRLRRFEQSFDIDLREGDDGSLACRPNMFHRATAIHSFQFWPQPEDTLERIHSYLKMRGVLCITLRAHGSRPPQWLPNPISRAPNEAKNLEQLLRDIGFENVKRLGALTGSTIVRAVKG